MAVKSLSRSGLQASGATNSMLVGYADEGFELITTITLTSSTPSVVFSSIPQNYRHLQIRWTGRNNQSWGSVGTSTVVWYQMNGVTSASYSSHILQGDGSSVGTSAYSNLDHMRSLTTLANAFSPSGAYSAGITDILDYTSTLKNKVIRSFTGYVSNTTEKGGVNLGSGALYSTNALTSFTIGAGPGPTSGHNFIAGSRFSLYGVK